MEDANIEDQPEHRHGRCCEITFAWCYGVKDIVNLFKALWQLDDDKLQEICGTDYTLYLIFLRFSSVLLFVITLFNCVVMVPLYVTGDPMPSDDYHLVETMSSMNAATILNVTGTKGKMIFSYIVAIIIIPTIAFYMIYAFR